MVADELAEHLRRYANANLIFPTREGSELTLGFRTIFQRAVARAGIPYSLSPNAVRHTAAAFAVAHGANVCDVQTMLGHKRPSITLDVYGFIWERSEERLAEELDRSDPGRGRGRVPAHARGCCSPRIPARPVASRRHDEASVSRAGT